MELNKTFIDGLWSKEINVTSFVQTNITPYLGDASFLAGPTERTKHIWNLCLKALEEERQHNGVRALDNKTVSTVTSHKAGYIDRENELIVGLQTDELLKRAIKPFGGINVVSRACKENGVEVDEKGCPLDKDNDGVPDYLDQDNSTPLGTNVNGKGVAISKDDFAILDNQFGAVRREDAAVTLSDRGARKYKQKGAMPTKFASVDKNRDGDISYEELKQTVNDFLDKKSTFTTQDINELYEYFFAQ